MSSHYARVLVGIAAFTLAALSLIGLQNAFAAPNKVPAQMRFMAHPVTPGTPSPTPPKNYSLPFNRNQNAVITNGPGEGGPSPTPGHYGKSAEAIDFSPKNYGWTQSLATKPGHVYVNGSFLNWGNLVVVKSDVAPWADAFYAYYAHLADPAPSFAIGDEIADRQVIGAVGQTGCAAPCIHIHTELRDLMSNNNRNSGDSTNHPIRRVTGIGWYPWYPNPAMNSGFVPRSTNVPINSCYGSGYIVMRWPAPSEFDHFDNSTGTDQLAGYSWAWSNHKGDIPDATPEPGGATVYTNATTLVVTGTQTKWWFHLRAIGVTSGVADPNEVAHQGPYKLKAGCPYSFTSEDWNNDFLGEEAEPGNTTLNRGQEHHF